MPSTRSLERASSIVTNGRRGGGLVLKMADVVDKDMVQRSPQYRKRMSTDATARCGFAHGIVSRRTGSMSGKFSFTKQCLSRAPGSLKNRRDP